MEELSAKKKITIMIAIMMAMFFAAINQTLVSTAMPKIIAILGGMDHYAWVITIYMLTSTIATVLVGKLSDIYGRKVFLLIGIVFFIIGAFLCGLSKDIFQMITYRGIQGVGAGVIMAAAVTAIGDLYSPRERGKWMGLMMAVFGVSSVIGPLVGGWIVDNMDWEWLFWIFLPLGVIAFAMILLLFPKVEHSASEKIDYLGMIFLSSAIVAMLLGFSWAGSKYAWGSYEIIGLFAATLIFIILFVVAEMKAESPVLPLSLFRNDIVTISNSVGFIMNAGMMGALIYLPFYVQGVEGISPTYSGYVTMPMSISMVILSMITGRLLTKTGKYKRFALMGLPIMIVGMLIMAFMNSVWMAVISMIVFGFGLGTGLPIFTITIQNAVSPALLGVATASSQLFRNLGGTIGIAVMGAIMQSGLIRHLKAAPPIEGLDMVKLDPALAEKVAIFQNPQILLDQPKLEQILASLPAGAQPMFHRMVETLRDALSASLSIVFLAGAAVIAVAFILVLFLREIPLRTSNKMPAETETLNSGASEKLISAK